MDWRYIESPARSFRTIRVDVRTEPEPLAALRREVGRHSLEGSVVRLVVTMTPDQEPQLRDAVMMPLLEGAFFAQINREIERTARDRLEGLDPDTLTPEHLLTSYLLAKGRVEADLAPYLEEARTIFEEPEAAA